MLSLAQVFLLTPCASEHRMAKIISFTHSLAHSKRSLAFHSLYIYFEHKIFLILFWHNLIFGVRHCVWGVHFDCALILYVAESRESRERRCYILSRWMFKVKTLLQPECEVVFMKMMILVCVRIYVGHMFGNFEQTQIRTHARTIVNM